MFTHNYACMRKSDRQMQTPTCTITCSISKHEMDIVETDTSKPADLFLKVLYKYPGTLHIVLCMWNCACMLGTHILYTM